MWCQGLCGERWGMAVFIRQLTGIRFVAAFWVLLYHLQDPLDRIGVMDIPVLSDVIRVGRLGVDLFFALSGFIITHTYLRRLGPRLAVGATVEFWWLRLARVYPVHFVMLNVAGIAIVAQTWVTGVTKDRPWLTVGDYLRNVLLIQEWGPHPDRGWNVVAWSLSMEWLAYLIFPLLVLVLFALHKRMPTAVLVLAWFVALTPLLWRGSLTLDPYYTDLWGSVIRVLTEFTAGAITYLIVIRLIPTGATEPTPRIERIATVVSVLMPIVVVAGAVFLGNWTTAQSPITLADPEAEPLPPFFHLWLVPPLIIWIGALALSHDPGRCCLLLPLHDAPGVVWRLARRHQRTRAGVGSAVCRGHRGCHRRILRHRLADVENRRGTMPTLHA